MENLNTNSTVNYSEIESRILQAIPLMTRENQLILLRFAETMISEGSSKYSHLTPTQRKMELIDVLGRMKSHSIVIGQFFCRLKTKRDALAKLEAEIANFQSLWELVRLDVMREIEEMGAQS